MGSEEEAVPSEPKFEGFPYNPYGIQTEFMNALYRSLDCGGISMLESPTGTGKTLSIICSSLQWVFDQRQKMKSKAQADSCASDGQTGSDDEPDWMRNFAANRDPQVTDKQKKQNFVSGKVNMRKNGTNGRELLEHDAVKADCSKKRDCKNSQKESDHSDPNDEEFLLEDYESKDEDDLGSAKPKRKVSGISSSLSSDEDEDKIDEEEEEENELKIYFCSRTHSQLTQFIKELRKTVFAEQITVLCLGSRKNFCINQEVLRLGDPSRINERCLELLNNRRKEVPKLKIIGTEGKVRKKKTSSGCPMLGKPRSQKQFRDTISQLQAPDIEDLVHLGQRIGTCPYYGARSMVRAADLVVLPYQSLLSKSSRESLGLNLKNSIIIIDEAHNLADSLISMYDAKVTLSQLEHVQSLIEKYFQRFHSLLGPGNRRYVQTLLAITRAFLKALHDEKDLNNADNACHVGKKAVKTKPVFETSMATNEFLFSLNIDNINFFKLLQYIKESHFAHKVSGYGEKVAAMQKGSTLFESRENTKEGSTLSSFQSFADILSSLTNNDGDGRIIISKSRATGSEQHGGFLKYVMLTGEKIFSEVVEESHAVILAGGTLQPIEEIRERLFPCVPPEKVQFFSCGHIVPPESILPIAVSCGPSGRSFDFSYSNRSSMNMIEELGLLLCNLTTVVPDGIIVFFSSFAYEGQVYDVWKSSGILERIKKKKYLFREPRKNSEVELVLKEYKETIDRLANVPKEDAQPQNGAVLLAVVGGKISEGINFSDGMGRCIVMVGLPYPSPDDIELMERIKYIENLGDFSSSNNTKISSSHDYYDGDIQSAFSVLRRCRRRGKEYYENLCMKAVNQSIGRAIRHVNDYAAMLLVDERYASPSSKNFSHPKDKLPQWIKDRLVSSTTKYGEVHRMLHQFFKYNKQRFQH